MPDNNAISDPEADAIVQSLRKDAPASESVKGTTSSSAVAHDEEANAIIQSLRKSGPGYTAPSMIPPIIDTHPVPPAPGQPWPQTPPDKPYDPSEFTRAVNQNVAQKFNESWDLARGGMSDLLSGNIAPSFPSSDPRTWGAGGLLKTGTGALGMPASIVTGPIHMFGDLATKLTGNPDFGAKTELLSTLMAPIPKVGSAATVTNKLANSTLPAPRAAAALIHAVGDENIPSVLERLQANPNLRVGDVSETARTLGGGLAADPANPTAQSIMRSSYEASASGRRAAAIDAFEKRLGPAPNVKITLDAIKQRAVDTGKNVIEPVVTNTSPVDTSGVIASIDRELKPGLQALATPGLATTPSPLQQSLSTLRNKLIDENGSQIVDPEKLHGIQSGLREQAAQLMSSSSGAERLLGRDLYTFRNQLIDAIDKASPQITDSSADFLKAQPNMPAWALKAPPSAQDAIASSLGWVPKTSGSYKPALAKYRDDKMVQEAFDKGYSGLRTQGTDDFPEYWQDWASHASPDELQAARLGMLSSIRQKIGTMKKSSNAGETIPDAGFTADRMRILFGDKATDALTRGLQDVKDSAETNSRWFQNSKTSTNTAALKQLEIPPVQGEKSGGINLLSLPIAGEIFGGHELGMAGLAAATTAKGGQLGYRYLANRSASARNTELANLISSTGPKRDQAISILRRRLDQVGSGNKFSDLLSLPLPR